MSQDIAADVRSEDWFESDLDSVERYNDADGIVVIRCNCLLPEDFTSLSESEQFSLKSVHGRFDDDDVRLKVRYNE